MLDLLTHGDFARHRRLRRTEGLRRLVAETRLSASDFVYPLFVTHGQGMRDEIPTMPGQFRISLDQIGREADELQTLGIPAVLLFGLPAKKDDEGSEAYAEGGIVQDAVRAFKEVAPDLVVITDVCLCEYTGHGHCGIIRRRRVDNDPTLELLARTAVSHAEAGADIVAPSDMMDGRVAAIRAALDDAGYVATPIMAYTAKYASALLRTVPRGRRQRAAVRRPARLPDGPAERAARPCARSPHDIDEGADIVMVKPALPYLDVISRGARANSTCRSPPTTSAANTRW